MRIGQGYDVHAFDKSVERQQEQRGDQQITLGGVCIPHRYSLVAHSDGDVLLHALCDALLGALALGDIGVHFPDTDPQYRDISSVTLLGHCTALVEKNGFRAGNVDATIIAQAPKMQPYIEQMRVVIAYTLDVEISAVSVKATTTERLGFCGREEGIACLATVLLQPVLSEPLA